MFIPDERFQAIFGEADTWTLQVKYVQARDEGEYECQISTDPKKSHIIKLNIVGERRGGRVGPLSLTPSPFAVSSREAQLDRVLGHVAR